jgi:hypothetical protein
MTGISEIMQGDEGAESRPPVLPTPMTIDQLHPWDQKMMRIWEESEPALPPWTIDPVVQWHENQKRKKRNG